MVVYQNDFKDVEDVIAQFAAPEDALTGAEVFFADYTYEDYSGSATVIFEKDGKLWEVNGSHCSCYGLEGQWQPEETSWEAIAIRGDEGLAALAKEKLGGENHGQ